jgi:hypothetical protein
MLDESQQPLAPEVREALAVAVRTGSREAFWHAVDLARRYGYA